MRENKVKCYGRDSAINELVASARRHGSVLLFGGRQAGKTTLLLKLTDILSRQQASISILSDIDLPVYIDLMRLPYDAKPCDFFYLLINETITICSNLISGFEAPAQIPSTKEEYSLEVFSTQLTKLKHACKEVNLHILFLLDESKRVLGDRFPRGFQDNLFSLLYGDAAGNGPKISMVFSGGQHLYKFSEDDTSPIGSRAGYAYVRNLSPISVSEMLHDRLPGLDSIVADQILAKVMNFTGGQAGLTTKMLAFICEKGKCELFLSDADKHEEEFLEQNFGLFENWALSLTNEGKASWQALESGAEISISKVAGILNSCSLDMFLAQRTLDELQYMGLATKHENRIYKVNTAFNTFASFSVIEGTLLAAQTKKPLWQLIEQTELALRDIIKRKYISAFGQNSEEKMESILGKETWDKIGAMKLKSSKSYPYSRITVERDSLSCMYFGNLMSLMISGKTWHLFKSMFKDKRQVEDIISAIVPVRNDSAHFTPAPPKEMARCEVSCDDLLVIVERETETLIEKKMPAEGEVDTRS